MVDKTFSVAEYTNLVPQDQSPIVTTPVVMSTTDIDSADDYDSEEEEEERINSGYKEWKKRRKEWTKGEGSVKPQQSILPRLSEKDRILAFKHLVVNNRKCKKPLPLADVLIILKAGWIDSGEWPTQ